MGKFWNILEGEERKKVRRSGNEKLLLLFLNQEIRIPEHKKTYR